MKNSTLAVLGIVLACCASLWAQGDRGILRAPCARYVRCGRAQRVGIGRGDRNQRGLQDRYLGGWGQMQLTLKVSW